MSDKLDDPECGARIEGAELLVIARGGTIVPFLDIKFLACIYHTRSVKPPSSLPAEQKFSVLVDWLKE